MQKVFKKFINLEIFCDIELRNDGDDQHVSCKWLKPPGYTSAFDYIQF